METYHYICQIATDADTDTDIKYFIDTQYTPTKLQNNHK